MSNVLHQTLADTGFADRSVLSIVLRRLGLRAAVSSARASIDALAHLLDQQREPLGCDRATLPGEGFGLTAGDGECGVGGGAVDLGEGHAMREDELLEGVKLVAQLLDRIDIGIRHGLFSSAGEPEGKPACEAAHRLSGGAK
jgi:hypothetical protein